MKKENYCSDILKENILAHAMRGGRLLVLLLS